LLTYKFYFRKNYF